MMPSHPSAYAAPWLYWFLFPIHRLLLALYFKRITIQGREYLPESGPMVIAPKHYSRWDSLIIALLSREPLYFMAKATEFTGLQGWLLRHLGAFPVDIDRPTISTLKTAIALLKSQKKLVIFPEGGIVRDLTLRDLQPGLARIVLQAESLTDPQCAIPIIPIALHYHPGAFWRAEVSLQICPPLYTQTYPHPTDKQKASAVTQALQEALLNNLIQVL